MSNWDLLNKHRVSPADDPMYGTNSSEGWNGFFCLMLNGLKVKAIASDGLGWRHVSVSIEGQTVTPPSWSIMCQVKDLFWEPEDWVVQFHPAATEYVNQHPAVLHLWQPTDQKLPIPTRSMVGIKDETDLEKMMKDDEVPFSQKMLNKACFLWNKALKGK